MTFCPSPPSFHHPSRCSLLDSDLASLQQESGSLRKTLVDKEQELGTLRECLRQIADGNETTGGEGVDGGRQEEEEEEGKRTAQLAKIQAMLDTTKVWREGERGVAERRPLTVPSSLPPSLPPILPPSLPPSLPPFLPSSLPLSLFLPGAARPSSRDGGEGLALSRAVKTPHRRR